MDDKKLVALILFLLFGNSITGGLNYLGTNATHDNHEDIFAAVAELSEAVVILDLTVEQIMDDDRECEARQHSILREHRELRELVTSYQSLTKQRDASQDQLIADCMRRTQ